jgi:hypothetical protein
MDIHPLAPDTPELLPPPLLQSAAAAAVLGAVRVMVTDGGMTVAQTLLLRRFGLTATLRGPLWHPDATPDQRCAAFRALRHHGLRLVEADNPTTAKALHAAGFRMVVTPAHVAELDLQPDPATRRRAMTGTWRNRLAFAELAGLSLHHRHLSGADDEVITAEAAQRRNRRYSALPLAFATAFPTATVVEARAKGAPVAAMMFLQHGAAATYHIGFTTLHGRRSEAHRLILSHMADHLSANGFTRLDLGTIDTQTASGLARFKLGSGATARSLGGSFLAIPGL